MRSQDFSGDCLYFANYCFKQTTALRRGSLFSKGNYTMDHCFLFTITIFQGTMGPYLQLGCCTSHSYTGLPRACNSTDFRAQSVFICWRHQPTYAVTQNTYRLETQMHLVKQQHFVFIRSSHGNITQSS